MKECFICKSQNNLVSGNIIQDKISNIIKEDFLEWNNQSICKNCLSEYRVKYIASILKQERGSLSELEKEVLKSMKNHEIIAQKADEQPEGKWTFGERVSDKIASFGGSWKFILSFAGFMFFWIFINSIEYFFRPFDPFPFILLNLILSTLAAIQAPIIMMSQNRVEAKDRLRSQMDYKIDLKAELEIQSLHEKIDHLIEKQYPGLIEVLEVQTGILNEILNKN